jgi:hypothetical protein
VFVPPMSVKVIKEWSLQQSENCVFMSETCNWNAPRLNSSVFLCPYDFTS